MVEDKLENIMRAIDMMSDRLQEGLDRLNTNLESIDNNLEILADGHANQALHEADEVIAKLTAQLRDNGLEPVASIDQY